MFDGVNRVGDVAAAIVDALTVGAGQSSSVETSGTNETTSDRAEVHRRRYYAALGREDHGSAEQQALHARFVRRAKQRTAWDAEEARDLREAVRLRVWEAVGCANIVEYLERYAGLSPRVAQDRLRVSEALAHLPNMEAALDEGLLHYSHVRELTHVATPATEEEWLDAASGMTTGETMREVSGRARGDRPVDPKRPELKMRTVSWRVRETTAARIHALISELQHLQGEAFDDDDDRLLALCDAAECGSGIASGNEKDVRGNTEHDAELEQSRDAHDDGAHDEQRDSACSDGMTDSTDTDSSRHNDEPRNSDDHATDGGPATGASRCTDTDSSRHDDEPHSSDDHTTDGGTATGASRCASDESTAAGRGGAAVASRSNNDKQSKTMSSDGGVATSRPSKRKNGKRSQKPSRGCTSCGCTKPCNVGFSMRTPTQVWKTDDGRAFAYGVELAPEEATYLMCNATDMGRVDDPNARTRPRMSSRRRRRLMARDGNKCTVPGCRSRHNLDIHHIIPIERGGDDSDENLTTLCSGHHRRWHDGRMDMKGTAPHNLLFSRPISDGLPVDDQPRAHVGTTH